MDPFNLDDSGHNIILGSEDDLQPDAAIDERHDGTGFDLNLELRPGLQQFGPEFAAVTPSLEVGQQSAFNFENLLAHAIRDVAESPVQLPWETDEWACIFDPNHDPLDALVPQFEPNGQLMSQVILSRSLCSQSQCLEERTRSGRKSGKLSCRGHS